MNQSQTPSEQITFPSRYQNIKKWGSPTRQNRLTYLAQDTATQQLVVIKQYIFGSVEFHWSGLEAYQAQMQTLLTLKHPFIPQYLDFFPSLNGFCAVRVFQDATPLMEVKQRDLATIQNIVNSLFTTLLNLHQSFNLIHCNLKPANILVDQDLNVYLVDFGFPFINKKGQNKTAFAGTPNFMPKEQIRNQELTQASDIYAVGVSLACFITNTEPTPQKLENLLGRKSRTTLGEVIPKEMTFEIIDWLENLFNPFLNRRYGNATEALEAFNQIHLQRLPEAKVKPKQIELKSTKYGEKIHTTISITNIIPDTILQGNWQLASKAKEKSNWLVFDPPEFASNRIQCDIIINTQKLQAEQVYERQVILQTNDKQRSHTIDITIETAPLFSVDLPRFKLIVLGLLGILGGWFFKFSLGNYAVNYTGFIIGIVLGSLVGFSGIFTIYSILFPAIFIATVLSLVPLDILMMVGGVYLYTSSGVLLGSLIGIVLFGIAASVIRYNYNTHINKYEKKLNKEVFSFHGILTLLVVIFGLTLGLATSAGLFNPLILLSLFCTGIPVGVMIYRFYAHRAKLQENYQKEKARLLKP